MISLIAVMSKNRVIGKNNSIPWNLYLPADRLWFKRNTMNKPIIMGRLTWESIGSRYLPGRKNIVISNTKNYESDNNVKWVRSIREALSICKNNEEVIVIGGERIYEQFLPKAEKLYITYVNVVIDGDAYFPSFCLDEWKLIFNEYHNIDYYNLYSYNFNIFKRRYYVNNFYTNI